MKHFFNFNSLVKKWDDVYKDKGGGRPITSQSSNFRRFTMAPMDKSLVNQSLQLKQIIPEYFSRKGSVNYDKTQNVKVIKGNYIIRKSKSILKDRQPNIKIYDKLDKEVSFVLDSPSKS